jgi:hypothetical protein
MKVVDKEKLTWRSFADTGDIAARWNLSATPTLYLLDTEGIIRYKWVGGPGQEAIDAAVGELIRAAERPRQAPP